MPETRSIYQGAYRSELEQDITTPPDEPGNPDGDLSTTSTENLSPEEETYKQRYGSLRTHSLSLNERIKSLEHQLNAAQKQEIKIPSTKDELTRFSQMYPDVYRHIRSIAMSELLQERENISVETKQVKDDLERIKLERGKQAILQAHPDFEELNNLQVFKDWATVQPPEIQDWMFASSDPNLCIRALDLFKAETNFKQKRGPGRPPINRGADMAVTPGGANVEVSGEGNKKIWKASEIGALKPRDYAKHEDAIELARTEGRIDMSA